MYDALKLRRNDILLGFTAAKNLIYQITFRFRGCHKS